MKRKKVVSDSGYSWTTSLFHQRLEKLSTKDPAARPLLDKVAHIAGQAAAISQYVVAFLPQYTDHGERHLTNVLQFMDELAGRENIEKLSALECALAIMTAFVHDLGMVPDKDEQRILTDALTAPDTPAGHAWQTYRDGHALWHRYQRLPAADRANESARQMFGQVKADYIRDTHAKESGATSYHRILHWLDTLAKGKGDDFYRHEGFTFREGLAHLAMSHGQDIGWLPHRLAAADSPYATVKQDRAKAFACGPDEINWPWLGWLLRLADVMDCDASRTPPVLFEAIGITDPKSQTEWKKHLAIPKRPEWNQGDDGQTLLYHCPVCPDPFTEKALKDIMGWINQEIENVRRERDANAKHFPKNKKLTVNLPSRAKEDITERKDNYTYVPLHFRLDQESVMELLMGEALYGEPDLALRELVQNSLDALHLRDLRHRLLLKLRAEDKVAELPVPVAPVLEDEKLEVSVRWDTPKQGRPWIEVEDNGVGMTREVIERFLTQIGKSYYKSPAFLRERELMKRHGLLCTTISQFGIGFLSSFMLAEEIEIETRAAAAGGGLETGWRVRIHGPHGLIALYPSGANRFKSTGTRVRLTLRDDLKLETFDADQFVLRLRKHFYDNLEWDKRRYAPKENLVEPAWSVARCIVWPLFPIRLHPPSAQVLQLDDSFHTRELVPLDQEKLRAKADDWDFPLDRLGQPACATWDWVDDGLEGTGSRVRTWFPSHDDPPGSEWLTAENRVPGKVRRSELLALTEPQLPGTGRTLLLVNGVLVPNWEDPLGTWLQVASGVGSGLWFDLRGPATPRLRADRRAPTSRQEMLATVRQVQERFTDHLAARHPKADAWIRLAIAGCGRKVRSLPSASAWLLSSSLSDHFPAKDGTLWLAKMWEQEMELARTRRFARARARDLPYIIDNRLELDRGLARTQSRGTTTARNLNLAINLATAFNPVDDLSRAFDHSLDLLNDLALYFFLPTPLCWSSWLAVQCVPEMFQPSLSDAFPALDCPFADGRIGDLALGGPLVLRPAPGQVPAWLSEHDLVAPLTGIPLGPLAQNCPRWGKGRGDRLLFTLPFLLCQAPEERHRITTKIIAALGVDSLLVYLPDPKHWDRTFAPIPPADFGEGRVAQALPEDVWRNSGATALWDIKTARVLWAEKLRTRAEMREIGRPLDHWAKKST